MILAQEFYSPKIVIDSLYSPALENTGGENPTRRITIYLPPGYEENTDQSYPVIYYLHGFTSSDSSNLNWFATDQKLEIAFQKHKIRPFILVVTNQHTLYKGSFYTNSSLTGNWADFTAIDLVDYIDSKYRTIPHRNSRGVCGWSMGGHGTIKMGMLYPEVFSCAYAMSPAVLTMYSDFTAKWVGFKDAQNMKTREELFEKGFDGTVVVAIGRAFSPNPDKPPFFADMPFSWKGDSLATHYDVLQKWYDQFPFDMLDSYAENFSKLNAFKIDWGKHDRWPYIPATSRMFSEKLEALGIEHYAEEYIGDHANKLWSPDGRMINSVLPFFDTYLKFE
jgi:enterochelin esterase-like enzyme